MTERTDYRAVHDGLPKRYSGRYQFASVNRTQRNMWITPGIPFLLTCFLLVAGVHVATAQCYTFSSGSATLSVNITRLPSPTMPEPGIYQYSSGVTGTASLTVGQTTYSPDGSQPVTLIITVGDDPALSFSNLIITAGFEAGNNTVAAASVSVSWSGNVFPNGSLPASLPSVSPVSNATLDIDIANASGAIDQSFAVTSVAGCSGGGPVQTGPPPGVTTPSLQALETYKGTDPQSCSLPAEPSNSFSPSDASVNVFLEVSGLNTSAVETVTLRWTNPSNASILTGPSAVASSSGGSVQCFVEDLSISQYIAPNWGAWHVQAYVNGNALSSPTTFQVLDPTLPALSIMKTHQGNFSQGQTGAIYTISISNSGTAATSGQVTVSDNIPAGLYLASMSGQNWDCSTSGGTCSRTDSLLPGAAYPVITVTVNVASSAPVLVTNQATVSGGAAASQTVSDSTVITSSGLPLPSITPGGIAPAGSTISTIQTGEWVTIYGTHLANSIVSWNGDFPTSLGGTSVTINGRAAYLSYVSPGQINLQAPDDTAAGTVLVEIQTATGTASSTVTLAPVAPSFLLLDSRHVAGIILRTDGSGAYGGGTYDILGPTGTSLGYPTVAAKQGDIVELFAVGLGPTDPEVPAGKSYSGAAATINEVTIYINGVSVMPAFAGVSAAGLYQLTFVAPASHGTGDLPLATTVGGSQTPQGVVISMQ